MATSAVVKKPWVAIMTTLVATSDNPSIVLVVTDVI